MHFDEHMPTDTLTDYTLQPIKTKWPKRFEYIISIYFGTLNLLNIY